MTRILPTIAGALVAACVAASSLAAQTPAHDPSARLREVLPADVAERVIARVAEARARELPAQALENRALKFAARGVEPAEIERAVSEHAVRLEQAKQALEAARAKRPSTDEVEAGAEAIRKGVDGAKVSELAKAAPSGRSLAVPLYVIGGLTDRGLPSDEALTRVKEQLAARASDVELEKLPSQVTAGKNRKPAVVGRDLAATKRPGTAGPPSGVPANGGSGVAPVRPPVQPPVSRP
jgi:hypothetical protein